MVIKLLDLKGKKYRKVVFFSQKRMVRHLYGGVSVLLFPVIMLTGCDTALFHDSQKIPNKIWQRDHTIRFEVPVEDTMKSYDFYIDLRNEGTYPYSNIYMFVNTTFPSGGSARDTVECILADRTGRWLGSGLGDIWDNHILFKKNVRFPTGGTYIFEFDQGMRMDALPDIIDLGISIEKR